RDGTTYFNGNASRYFRRKRTLLAEELTEGDAADELNDEVLLILSLRRNIVDFDDVGMLHLGDGPSFALKSPTDFRALTQVPMDQLQRDFTIQPTISCSIHRSHAAMSDLLKDLVLVERNGGMRGQCQKCSSDPMSW